MAGFFKRSLSWIVALVVLLLLTGLTHMYARVTTLGYVQGYDFLIFKNAFDRLDVSNHEDGKLIKSTTNVLGSSDRALFSVAVISGNTCLENDGSNGICKLFPVRSVFESALSKNKVHTIAGKYLELNVMEDSDRRYFVFDKLQGGDLIVAETLPYLIYDDSFLSRESLFFKDIPKYLSTYDGFSLMYRKSIGAWVFLIIIIGMLFVSQEVIYRKKSYEFKRLNTDKDAIEKRLLDANESLSTILFEKDALENEISEIKLELEKIDSLSHSKADLENTLKMKMHELHKKDNLVSQVENHHLEDLNKLYNLEKELENLRNKLSNQDQDDISRQEASDLNELKSLWLNGKLTWDDRLAIEGKVSFADLDRAPFTDYIVYTSFEQWIVRACNRHKLAYPGEKLELYKQIDLLKNANIVSDKEADLLHEARIVRNNWFHSGVKPTAAFTSKVVKFLKIKNSPKIDPRV
ncbi:hypothetical protein SAMN05216296_0074 [Pseudomonas pohangensis]|uniref:DUF4145 domain-containing protein n=1 Tax=Pseudomonas pohangensis TaxID=364197 RepID=A0A1H2DVY9_9PSED|nr:hypothetical protein [Pseudomonas pohangensis]SDT86991.1 hypothetical protein SAMN05216296_0074 [Pseudomonas pohangensis]